MKNKLQKYRSLPLDDRIVHIHIPKTGGTWLNANLINLGMRRNYDHSTVLPLIDGMSQRTPTWAWDIKTKVSFQFAKNPGENIKLFQEACKVAIVRNPFDWLVSYYSHVGHGRWKNHRGWDDIVSTHNLTSFEHFLYHFCTPEKRWYHIWFKRSIFYQIFDENGNVGVDVILKNENLTEGTKTLLLDLGIIRDKSQIITMRSNQNKTRKDYRSYYDTSMIDLVSNFLSQELKIFNYEFENSHADRDYWLGEEFGNLNWQLAMSRTDY